MKRLTLILLIIFAFGWKCQLQARLPLGEWQAFMAYDKTSTCVFFNGKVYAVSEGSLISYDPEDEDIQTFDLVYPMSDINITHLATCPAQKKLLIVYENGNIDLMNEREEVYNITDLKNSNVTDKTINNINVEGSKAYMATNFGIVVLDIAKRVISTTYTLEKKIVATSVIGDYIMAATAPGDGLYYGKLTDNLLEKDKWTRMMTNTFTLLKTTKGVVYACIPGYALLTVDPEKKSYELVVKDNFTFLKNVNGKLFAGNADGKLYVFNSPKEYNEISIPKGMIDIAYGNSTYWIASTEEKLTGYKLVENEMQLTTNHIELNAPRRNLFYQMFMHNGKLYTCGGGIYLDRYSLPGTIQVLNSNNNWQIFQEEGITNISGKLYQDITSLAVDPNNDNHVYASSAGEGVYEFLNGELVTLHTPLNSSISSDYRYPNIIRVNGLAYDKNKNLWCLCAKADSTISILTHDKRWIKLFNSNFSKKSTLRNTFFDVRGWMWAVTPHHNDNGVFILNTNETLENTADDKSLFINRFHNQDGTLLEHQQVHCAIEDKEGVIWLGTTNGTWLITNPTQLMAAQNGTVTVTQVKVPRNDGTNLADYLLEGVTVLSIAIDGANRKWIGTEKNGIYLISADGLEAIHHFTTENSPLPSDEVRSIATDEVTGMVYIGTSKGLVAYQSDATEAQPSFEESNVRAYPNPVRPDYQGYIRIDGLMMNSQVKITDSFGSIICEGMSTGGSFSWNGRNSKGNRVASGVYHVLATNENGQEGVVTKIVMIK